MPEAPGALAGGTVRSKPRAALPAFTVAGGDLRVASAYVLTAGCVLNALPGEAGIPCPLRTTTGVPCPLCGMTTSVKATLGLRLEEAAAATPAGIVAVLASVLVLLLRPARLRIAAPLLYGALAAMWAFQLVRFSVV